MKIQVTEITSCIIRPHRSTTPWAVKRSQLIFFRNFVKNQLILMQFSLIDLEMNGTCDSMNFTHFT